MNRLIMVLIVLLALSGTALAQDTTSPVFAPAVCAYTPDQPTSQACLDLMAARSELTLENVPLDGFTLGSYSFWKVGPDVVNKYDAPGGNVVDQIPAGFNFVSAITVDNPDWLQIQGGQWIPKQNARYVEASIFTGVLLPDDWNQPFAWVLDKTGIYASLTPGGKSVAESGYLTRRYDLVNIYAEAYDAEGWRWYMIGPNQWLKQTFVAKVQPAPHPTDDNQQPVSGRWFAVDLYEQTLVAYEDDKPAFATLIASGLDGWDTEEGLFPIWARMPADPMSGATGAPDAYALQTVPWVMYFNGSTSLHGTYWHDLFGYRRSHGCVNLSISDAKWVFNWAQESTPNPNGDIMNYVYVFSSGEYGLPPQQVVAASTG